ncbi:GerMN domain-containing protein [Desulfolucanica intricata]|uniref:GerMN domain-containing protein n=1 Tax=Desulfolucanica intricata TaxID=1285191 RepID=UPI00082DD51C|nr:GerMN domain-containing protein [Desulfolucanica intricata]
MRKQLLRAITLSILIVFISLPVTGCSENRTIDSPKPSQGDKIELTVYLNGPYKGGVQLPMVPVKRVVRLTGEDTPEFRVKAALEALIKGPTDKEEEEGLSTALPKDVKVLNVDVKRPYATVNFSSELQKIGGSMMIGSLLDQIKYTLTELDGISGIIIQVNGEQVGTEANPFGGEGITFNVLSRVANGEWVKKISPARSLDYFIVSIGNAKEMWQWMGPAAKKQYKSPEKLNVSEFVEGMDSWRDYEVVSEDIQGNRATVIIKGNLLLEGTEEKGVQYSAAMIKEDGQWKWEHGSKK